MMTSFANIITKLTHLLSMQPFSTPPPLLKTSENHKVFRGQRQGAVGTNWFTDFLSIGLYFNVFYYSQKHSRSSPPDVFLGKGALKPHSKFTGEHLCRSVILKSCFATLLKSHFGMGFSEADLGLLQHPRQSAL